MSERTVNYRFSKEPDGSAFVVDLNNYGRVVAYATDRGVGGDESALKRLNEMKSQGQSLQDFLKTSGKRPQPK